MIHLTANAQSNPHTGKAVWEANKTITSDDETFLMPDESGTAEYWTLSIYPIGSGSGKWQYTRSPRSEVIAGTAKWQDWDNGVVSAYSDDSLFPVQAVKLVHASGIIRGEVLVI